MKSYKHLIEYAASDECIFAALENAIKEKKSRRMVQEVLEHKEEIAQQIKRMLLTGEYPTRPHKVVIKKDGFKQKERIIVLPYFEKDYPEQWIQHIVVLTIKKILLKGAYFHSYASLPGRGMHAGKKRMEKYIRKNDVRYFFKADIRKFYNSIDTDILKKKFARIIKDKLMLKAIYWCIDNNDCQMPDGSIERNGIPIGSYTSQWFANFYLQDFDHYVKEVLKAPFYIRYMDDIVILHTNKRELHKIKDGVIKFLTEKENLVLKPNYSVQKFDYTKKDGKTVGTFIDFMGFKFYRNKTTIRRSIFYRATRLARRTHKMIKKTGRLMYKNAAAVISYFGWFKYTDTYQAYMKYISPMISLNGCKALVRRISRKAWWNHARRGFYPEEKQGPFKQS